MKINAMGIDLAKTIFHVHGVDETGKVALKKKLNRKQLREYMATTLPTKVGLEACGGAHHWARELIAMGHEVRIIPPQFVKPYVKSNKNDANDAAAICEALTRPHMRFVNVKTIEQQEILMLHRIRALKVKQRTALVNELRGLVMEFGITIPQGIYSVKKFLINFYAMEQKPVSSFGENLIIELGAEIESMERKVKELDKIVNSLACNHPVCQKLMTIPGVGPITATAIMASVGDATHFKNARQFAAWLGLVPRQNSTGGKSKLLGISKRGDTYLRTLLIHGSRNVLRYVAGKKDKTSLWAENLKARKGYNKAAVALANKTARVLWVILTGKDFEYRFQTIS